MIRRLVSNARGEQAKEKKVCGGQSENVKAHVSIAHGEQAKETKHCRGQLEDDKVRLTLREAYNRS